MSDMMQVRSCFVPRPGYVFFQADYEQLELHTFAQICFDLFGYSDLGDALNSGLDPHTELASEILEITLEEARQRRKLGDADKEFDRARHNGKGGNFGFIGGMGVTRFSATADVSMALSKKIRNAWFRKWREAKPYLDRGAERAKDGPFTLVDQYTGRVRGNTGYCDGCNDGFQGLGATVAKRATWLVSRACYAEPESPMYGSRIVNVPHDEIIGECLDNERAHDVAKELERLMILAGAEFMPRVPCKAPPLLMAYWSKSAKATYDSNGRLVPWRGK